MLPSLPATATPQTNRSEYALVALVAVALAPGAAAGEAAAGRGVAEKWRARCHVVGPQNPHGSIESTPSFLIFARMPGSYPPQRIRTLSERPPHPQFEIKVSERELDDLIAHIATLKPQ